MAPAAADTVPPMPVASRLYPVTPRRACLLPQTNGWRTVLDLSGLWSFRLDRTEKWFGGTLGGRHRRRGRDVVRLIAVPGSWNAQFQDPRDFEGLGCCETVFAVPTVSADRRVVLHAGSTVYAATRWIDGREVGAQITTLDPSPGLSHRYNAGNANSLGAEIETNVHVLPQWEIDATATRSWREPHPCPVERSVAPAVGP